MPSPFVTKTTGFGHCLSSEGSKEQHEEEEELQETLFGSEACFSAASLLRAKTC